MERLEKWKPSVSKYITDERIDGVIERLEAAEAKNLQSKQAAIQPQTSPQQQKKQQQIPKIQAEAKSADQPRNEKTDAKKSETTRSSIQSSPQNQQSNQTASISVNAFARLFKEKQYSDIIDAFERRYLSRLGKNSDKTEEVPLACINLVSASHLMIVIFNYF